MNTVNNKTYIGVHKTDRDDFDGYIGCGVNINRPATYKKSKTAFQYAVNKYGTDKFIRSTLFTFDNEKDAQQFYNPSRKSEIGKKIIILMNFTAIHLMFVQCIRFQTIEAIKPR